MGADVNTGLPKPLRWYVVITCVAGLAFLAYLAQSAEWSTTTFSELGLFVLLIVAAGSFPLQVGPKVKADLSTVALFGAVLVLEPGVAALAGVIGVLTYTLLLRFWRERIQLPWYKYAFNAGQHALFVGLASLAFHTLNLGDGILSPAVVPAAISYYFVNTALVSIAMRLQLGMNPIRFWLIGTRENGLVEISLFAFGFLGAVSYHESPATVLALVIPVFITYFAFSRLAEKINESRKAREALQEANEELEIRVALRTAELSSTNEQLARSRRRVVNAQEDLRKAVAQQLHGPVQNRLLVATHWLQTASEDMGHDNGKSAEHIAKAAQLIHEINQEDLRAAVRRLHPSLIRMSLQSALRSLSDEFASTLEVAVNVEESDPETEELWRKGLPEELRLAMYRIAEEALGNVLKYASATRVELRLERPHQDRVCMTIQDNGSGFEVDETTPGFGILSMQDYCGSVGGALNIKSTTGEGTTVTASFTIGQGSESPAKGQVDLSSLANGTGPSNGNGNHSAENGHVIHGQHVTNLMVVDDQPDFCGLVRELLKPYDDFQITAESHDGLAALKMIENNRPDVVLLDMEMPGLHGLETAVEINSRFPGVKVVLMSAYHRQESIEDALPQGASDFIHKAEFSVNRLREACHIQNGTKSLSGTSAR